MNTFKMALLKEIIYINSFIPNVPFESPENIRKPFLFWCFQGDQKVTLGRNELTLKDPFIFWKLYWNKNLT